MVSKRAQDDKQKEARWVPGVFPKDHTIQDCQYGDELVNVTCTGRDEAGRPHHGAGYAQGYINRQRKVKKKTGGAYIKAVRVYGFIIHLMNGPMFHPYPNGRPKNKPAK